MAALKRPRQDVVVDIETGFSPVATRWLALYTVAPTATTDGTEVTGGSYARPTIPFGASVGGIGTSNAEVTYAAATADWGVVVAWAVCSAVSGAGNQRFYKTITPRSVTSGDVVKAANGAITFKVD